MKRAWSLALCAVLVGCHVVLPFRAARDGQDVGVAAVDVRAGDGLVETTDPGADGAPWVDVRTSDGWVPPVDPMKPFENVREVTELFDPDGVDDPSLTADPQEIYFERDGNVTRATRTKHTAPWTDITDVLTSGDTPFVLPNGLTLYWATQSRPADIWLSRRKLRTEP